MQSTARCPHCFDEIRFVKTLQGKYIACDFIPMTTEERAAFKANKFPEARFVLSENGDYVLPGEDFGDIRLFIPHLDRRGCLI